MLDFGHAHSDEGRRDMNKIDITPVTKCVDTMLHLFVVEANLFNRKIPNSEPLWAHENAVV